jgi:septal ring-binding cell division protein DamX
MEAAPEARNPWDAAVSRFTGSIDLRLDILENELGEVQDELTQQDEINQGRTKALERRLTNRYAVGQILLGVLIVILFFATLPERTLPTAPSQIPPAPTKSGVGATSLLPAEKDAPAGDFQPAKEASSPPKDTDTLPGAKPREDPDPSVRGTEPSVQDPAAVVPAVPDIEEQQASVSQAAGTGSDNPPVGETGPAAAESDGAPQPATTQDASLLKEDGESSRSAGPDGSPEMANPPVETPPSPEPTPGVTVLESDRYVIQLISFRNRSKVAPFAERFKITETARYTRNRGQGKDWYLVFFADYETRSDAAAAMETLPAGLQALKPWIRTLPAGTSLRKIGTGNGTDSGE